MNDPTQKIGRNNISRIENISNGIWADPDFSTLSSGAKYLYLWSFSNPACDLSGIYKTAIGRISYETGLEAGEAAKALNELIECKYVEYEDGWLWVRTRTKHLHSRSPKLGKAIINGVNKLPLTHSFRGKFIEEYKTVKWLCGFLCEIEVLGEKATKEDNPLYPIDNLCISYAYPIDRLPITYQKDSVYADTRYPIDNLSIGPQGLGLGLGQGQGQGKNKVFTSQINDHAEKQGNPDPTNPPPPEEPQNPPKNDEDEESNTTHHQPPSTPENAPETPQEANPKNNEILPLKPEKLPEIIKKVTMILTECKKLKVNEMAIDSAVAAYRHIDAVQAAYIAVTWASSDGWKTTDAGLTLVAAFRNLEKSQKSAAKKDAHIVHARGDLSIYDQGLNNG